MKYKILAFTWEPPKTKHTPDYCGKCIEPNTVYIQNNFFPGGKTLIGNYNLGSALITDMGTTNWYLYTYFSEF